MMLHLGNDMGVRWRDIVAILNIEPSQNQENQQANPLPEAFFNVPAERIRYATDDPPKSLVLVTIKNEPWLYYSSIGSATLLRRSKLFYDRHLRRN